MNLIDEHRYVTKTILPDKQEYLRILEPAWAKAWLTNHGELENKLREELKNYLAAPGLVLCANGTLALQLALRAAGVAGGEVVTTPFTYVATSAAIAWEGARPVFADIEPETLVPTAESVASRITDQTKAILAVHVFGSPARVEELAALAAERGLPLIFDAAHCFGVVYKNKPLASYGDLSTLSFHATKVFHTAEGGAVICQDEGLAEKIFLLSKFGHIGDDYQSIGINAKLSELHAAMGLAMLPLVEEAIEARRKLCGYYDRLLPLGRVRNLPVSPEVQRHNYAFYPLIMENEEQLLQLMNNLEKKKIHPRRYFWPSLDTLLFLNPGRVCPVSRDIVSRILCLPLYSNMPLRVVQEISESVNDVLLAGRAFFISRSDPPPKVAVLTLAYNQENFIEDCLKSVAAQECGFPFEHIVGDDASSDRTGGIIRDYASKYKHIRPIMQKERTYGRGNVEAVFRAAGSPYVSICEGDDFFLDPFKLQKQAQALDEQPSAAVCAHPVEVLVQETGEKYLFPKAEDFPFLKGRSVFGLEDILRTNFIQTNSVMYRWRFAQGLPQWFNYNVMPQDWYWHILHAETGNIIFLPEAMSCYRRHSGGLWAGSYADPEAHIAKWAYPLLRFQQVLGAHFKNTGIRRILKVRSWHTYFWLIRFHARHDPAALNFYRDLFPDEARAYARPPMLELMKFAFSKRGKIKAYFKDKPFKPMLWQLMADMRRMKKNNGRAV
jgi:dTDP-4-amino-4,6-dideoxygalactose transaminase/glycosyltransferase involved in cell wall biosynthesis